MNVKHKFTGQEYDAETGLYFYKSRYYDPILCRFITPDTIIPSLSDPQAFNRYSYCRNNPVIYTDPSGHFLILPVLFAALFSGAVAEIQHPGNFWKGFLTGAISAIFFGWAGDLGGGIGNHVGAGMVSGGINAAIMGGDPAKGMLFGGLSAGLGEAVGGMIKGDHLTRFMGSTIAGGTTSGIVTMMYGGNFWDGFGSGALTAAAGVIYNDFMHDAVNAISGFGDSASFGGSKMVREAWGYDDVVDTSSSEYGFGDTAANFFSGGKNTIIKTGMGLISPKKYFMGKTLSEIKSIFEAKFGPPKSVRPTATTYYNQQTTRSFNVHQDPNHKGGLPHIDIRNRKGFSEKTYFSNGE